MFLKFMFKNALKPEVRPFTYGFVFTWFSINYLSCSGSAEARAASKYCNPPKHHWAVGSAVPRSLPPVRRSSSECCKRTPCSGVWRTVHGKCARATQMAPLCCRCEL